MRDTCPGLDTSSKHISPSSSSLRICTAIVSLPASSPTPAAAPAPVSAPASSHHLLQPSMHGTERAGGEVGVHSSGHDALSGTTAGLGESKGEMELTQEEER